MEFFSKILEKIGLSRKAAFPSVLSSGSQDPVSIWRTTKKIHPETALAVYAGWVYACTRAIAEDISAIEFELYKIKPDEDRERIYDHELLDQLDAVNSQQTGLELKYLIAAHLELVGNAYLYLEGVKTETGKPKAIHVMNPARVKVIVNRNEFPTQIEKYEYRTQTKIYEFKPYEVLHIKNPDPADLFEGIGTVQSIPQWVDADNYAMEFNRRFFLNGARIGGFIESKSAYTPEQLTYLSKAFDAIAKGVENAYKTLALPKDAKYTAASQAQKDMDFVNLMTMMRDHILAGFRVPRTVLGITDDVNRANAEATNYVFALRTIKPKMKLIVSYLNEFLVPRYGDDLHLSFTDPVPENRAERITEMQAATGSAPVISVNEAREEYFGLEPVENGDEVARPMTFLGTLGKPKPRAANKPKQKAQRIRKTRHARNVEIRKSLAKEIAKRAAKELKDFLKKEAEIKEKNIADLNDDEYEIIWKAFVTRVIPYEKASAQAIREFNADQKKEVLENLSRAIKSKAIDKTELFDQDEWVGILVDLQTPILTELFKKEGEEAAALLGAEGIEILTPEVRKALKRSIELLGESYNDTTRKLLAAKLEQGLDEGLGLEELKDLIEGSYEGFDAIRAEQIARTETFRVANEANKEAWKQTGVVKTIRWFTAADERVDPFICAPLHGKVISIEENFFNKGDELPDGSIVEYDNIGTPPAHPSCRCYIRPETIELE